MKFDHLSAADTQEHTERPGRNPETGALMHMGIGLLVISSAVYSTILALCLAVLWGAGSVTRFILIPIYRIDVDFNPEDDLLSGMDHELWN